MSSLTALAVAESRMLARNRTAAFNALALPLGFGLLWLVLDGPDAAATGAIAALQVVAVLTFTVYAVATTTLVARRQQRVLKRWRSSAASTLTILTGTLAPLGLLLIVQAGVLLAVTGVATGARPANAGVVALAALAGAVLCGALAFVTAAFTRTPETATVTATPLVVALLGGAVWTLGTAPGEVTWPMLATGGGAIAHLTRLGWEDAGVALTDPMSGLAGSLGVVAALAAVAVAVAVRVFRWDPRS